MLLLPGEHLLLSQAPSFRKKFKRNKLRCQIFTKLLFYKKVFGLFFIPYIGNTGKVGVTPRGGTLG